jgi:hypothetical protein
VLADLGVVATGLRIERTHGVGDQAVCRVH